MLYFLSFPLIFLLGFALGGFVRSSAVVFIEEKPFKNILKNCSFGAENLACGVLFVLNFLHTHEPFIFIILSLNVLFLAVIVVVDFKTMYIPDLCVILGCLCGFAYLFLTHAELIFAILVSLGFAFCFWLIGFLCEKFLKKPALGFGDVKLLFALGLFLDWTNIPLLMLVSGVSGIIFFGVQK
jgi:prepilin signal peptidase PulO-like enzyme (type II secretory pathway)